MPRYLIDSEGSSLCPFSLSLNLRSAGGDRGLWKNMSSVLEQLREILLASSH